MSDKTKTLQEAVNYQPGSYVSGGFQATVVNAKSMTTKTGKVMHKAKLSEGDLTADAVSFTSDFAPFVGKLVKFVGMGLARKDDYNGVPQFTIGDKARWIPTGDAPTVSPTVANTPQNQHQVANSGAQAAGGAIAGVTVGMAINKAVDILIRTGDTNTEAIWKVASDIIRVSERLQRGELAPSGTRQSEEGIDDEGVSF